MFFYLKNYKIIGTVITFLLILNNILNVLCYLPTKAEDNEDNVLQTVYEWKKLDFEYPTYKERQNAIAKRSFIPENNLPLGIDRFGSRIFVTTPRWKDGVPASLNYLPMPPKERSPALLPYPNWSAHGDPFSPDCTKLMSVYRTAIDVCNRMWVIDSGVVNATVSLNQVCPPKIVVFDLDTDQQILSYSLPTEQIREDSLHTNIVVETSKNNCRRAFAYVTDVWRYGLVVFSLEEMRSWRVTNYLFAPVPENADFQVYGLNFQWLDGIFGMSLSNEALLPRQEQADPLLYFHPMASLKEYTISTSLLRNETSAADLSRVRAKEVMELGTRGSSGQSSTSGITRNGVMFFTQVQRDSIACWHTSKPYDVSNMNLLLPEDNQLIRFPNDLKIDRELRQSVWVMSNSLPIYLYSSLNFSEINFRILRADAQQAVAQTVCNIN